MWKIARAVSLEPIPGGLFSGVPIRRLATDGDKFIIKYPGPKNLSLWIPNDTIEEFCKGQEDGFVFSMISSIKHQNHSKVDMELWKPFMVSKCELEIIEPYCTVAEKFLRVTQKFKITGKSSGMFQLICMNWKTKFNDQYYAKNDILTVHYGKNMPDPWPSYQNVIPEEAQTFVPVTIGSKINVLVNEEKKSIADPCPGSKIKFLGRTFLDHSFEYLGSPLAVYRYGITEDLGHSDCLYLKQKNYQNQIESKSIIFTPFRETAGFRYFFIREPYSKAAVLTQGCNAIKLITRTMLPMKIGDNCPASVAFTSRIGDLTFYMIKLHSLCPLILIEKNSTGWEVRCPF